MTGTARWLCVTVLLLAPWLAVTAREPALTAERVEIVGPVRLPGHWFVAATPGPRPAVLALHGCNGAYDSKGGLNELQRRYAALFHGLQMHVLVLDSFSPRGERSICEYPATRRPVTLQDRRDDVAAALTWLAARPDVDATRLVLLGWSNGAQTVLAALDASDPAVQARTVHPRAAVAFYPGCTQPLRKADYRLQSPLIMLLGELDDWTPAKPCKELHRRLTGQPPLFELESYPDSYHAFDSMNTLRVRGNVGSTRSGTATVGANPAARDASRERMLRFLDTALR